MQLLDIQALVGAATLVVLASLCLFLWRRLGYPSAPWFAAGFFFSAASLLTNVALDAVHQETPPEFLTVGRFIVNALFSVGLIKLSGLSAEHRRRWLQLVLGTLVLGYSLAQALSLDYIGFASVVLCAQLELLVLYAGMAWRNPRQGYAFVCASLALFPLSFMAFVLGGLPIALVRYQSPMVYVLVTMSGMTVRMLRERNEVRQALLAKEAAQELLQSLNRKLDERVAARTMELEEVVRYQDGFNRSVAHDLRGPVGSISSYSTLLVECLDKNDLGAVRKGLPAIAKQAESVVRTVNALLRLARASDVKLQLTTAVLEDVVRTALQDVSSSQPAAAASVPVHLNPLPTVVADIELIKQLYTNLLSNALKFSRARAHAQVEVGCETTRDETFVFYVRDNGAGFDMQRAERLFEPFVRMHGRDFEGTGVGLSICKRIVTRHAGTIWVESSPDSGTSVYFTLGQPERPVDSVRRPWYTETVLVEPAAVSEAPVAAPPPALF